MFSLWGLLIASAALQHSVRTAATFPCDILKASRFSKTLFEQFQHAVFVLHYKWLHVHCPWRFVNDFTSQSLSF